MLKKFISGLLTLVIGTSVLVACSSENDSRQTGEDIQNRKVTMVGSTTVAIPMELVMEKYREINEDVTVEIQGVGSSAGIKAVMDGVADIGMSSRNLKDEEKSQGLIATIIAYDGIGIIVHPSNPVTNLTKEQIKDIFEGRITSWKEVGGRDKKIVVVTREQGSGSRDAFEELLNLQEEKDGKKRSSIIPAALVAEGTGTMIATVSSKEGSIGFVSLGFINDRVKLLSIDDIKPTKEAVTGGIYTLSRPLILLTKKTKSTEVQQVIDFILSEEGQKIIGKQYIPVKED